MKQNKIVIGLIGGSGTGKSIFCSTAEKLGYTIIDGDSLGHEVILKNGTAYEAVVKEFGSGILDGNGEINRRLLGAAVFSDKSKLLKLNSIVHPCIEVLIKERLTDKCVIDAAVLHNTPVLKLCTHVIFIKSPYELRLKRITERDGIKTVDAENRLKSQPDDSEFAAASTAVLRNDGSKEQFIKAIKECLDDL